MESPPVKTKPKRSRHRRSKKAMVSALDAENSGPSPRKPNFKENSPCNEIDEPLESGENKEEFVSVTTKYDDPESNAFAEMLELTYLEKRKEIVELEEGKGGIVTPLVALKITAAELEFPIKFYIYKLRDGGLYFVQVSTGLRLGLGECSRLKMAIQMACADLLDKIQTKGGYILTSHGLPPGCRINPVIFGTLLDVCNRRGYEKPVFLQVESDEYDMSPPSLYTFTCVTGKFLTYGYSDSKCLAKRWAAKRMYEKLTGEIVPLDRVCRGPDIQAWRRFGIKAAPLKKMTKCPVIKPAPSAIQLPTGEYFEEELDFFDIENEQDQNSLQDQLKMNESFAELSISATESL